jgi:hypothetical protein
MFGPILESFGLSLFLCSPGLPRSEVNDAQVGSWRDCFVMSWPVCEFFPHGCFVMSWLGGEFLPRGMMRWMG